MAKLLATDNADKWTFRTQASQAQDILNALEIEEENEEEEE